MEYNDIELIDKLLDKTSSWLRFAEKKNGMVIGLSGGVIFAFIQIFKNSNLYCNHYFIIYFYNFLIFIILAIICSLISFIPQTKMSIIKRKKSKKDFNVYFFSDLEHVDPEELVSKLYNIKFDNENKINGIIYDIAQQVIIISKIAKRKFFLFKISIFLIICGILTPVIGVFLFFYLNPNWDQDIYER